MSVRLCVCSSVTHRFLSKRLYISSNFFHHWVATPLYFYSTKRYGNISTETDPPPLQARLIRGYEKIGFSTYLTVSWKQYKIRPLLLCYKLLNGTIFNDLSDSVKYLMARSIARPLCDEHLVITYDMNTPKTSKHNYTLQSAAEAAAVAATF